MMKTAPVTPGILEAAAVAVGRYRWRICALLFFATTFNYIDRQVLGVLAPELQRAFGWNEIQYSNIINAFQAAYALGLLSTGRLIDRVGTRIGYATSIGVWSAATLAHALVRSIFGFGVVRFVLGFGEAGNFPAGIKTVAEWFPRRERALATGIFNAGTNIGATIAPLIVPWLTLRFGWQSAFLASGLASALWIIPWLIIYRPPGTHPRLSAAEYRYIQSDPEEPAQPTPWSRLLIRRQTWAFLIGKFLTDPIWWVFMFWLPKFLSSEHHLSLAELGWPLVVIYNIATLGSVLGGWLPAQFLRIGWTLNCARKSAMLLCALGVAPVILTVRAGSMWEVVALLGLATASHQGWSANLFTLASDMFPKREVASVVGIGGFGGAIGGMIVATITGLVLQYTGSYLPMFLMAGSSYLLALLLIHLTVSKIGGTEREVERTQAERS
jgi:ACS family hexuronate transporter-like MFS transporter